MTSKRLSMSIDRNGNKMVIIKGRGEKIWIVGSRKDCERGMPACETTVVIFLLNKT